MIRPFVRRLASLTRTARVVAFEAGALPGAASAVAESGLLSAGCCWEGKGLGGGFPSRWATSMSSGMIGGWSFRGLLHNLSTFSSRVPFSLSGRPKMRIEPLRPYCFRSSFLSSRSVTRPSSFSIRASRSAIWRRNAAFRPLVWRSASCKGAMVDRNIFFSCSTTHNTLNACKTARVSEPSSPWLSVAMLDERRRCFQLDMPQHRISQQKLYWAEPNLAAVPVQWSWHSVALSMASYGPWI